MAIIVTSMSAVTSTSVLRADDSDREVVSEPNIFHSVLLDHEYECSTGWDSILEELTSTADMDSINDFAGIENEIEIEHETQAFNIVGQINQDIVTTNPADLNIFIPPSPATANLQDILQLAYNRTEEEHGIEEVISYDHQHLIDTHEQSAILDFHLETLDEIETGTRSSTALLIGSSPASSVLPPSTITATEVCNGRHGSHARPKVPYKISSSFMQNSYERFERFKSGLNYICTKIRRMRQRTGAMTQGRAEYEGDRYHYDVLSESFEIDAINRSLFCTDSEPSDGDDHRYAAQMLKQSSSWPLVCDHQYENDKTIQVIQYDRQVSESECQSTKVAPTKLSFEKRTYERNKSFCGHIHSLFSETVPKLEEQTGAVLYITVSYQNHFFTKTNYKDAHVSLSKQKRRHRSASRNDLSYNSIAKPRRDARQIELSQPKVSQPRRKGTKESFKSPFCNSANPGPVCCKCSSERLPNSTTTTNGFVPWIRCNDPFCQYLVHATCLGFLVSSQQMLKTLPPFYCKSHRG